MTRKTERILAAVVVLIAAAVTAGAVWLAQRERDTLARDLRYIPRPEVITPEIELLREYLRIDTSTREGVAAGARWLAAQLQRRGVAAQVIESAPGYFNVYARIEGQARGKALLLLNHIDVVPPGQGWTEPPFEGKIVRNELYGRGALDMKSVAVCQLLATANVARGGRKPAHDLVFLATADEEQGSGNGMLWLLAHRPELFESVEFAVTEGGLAEVMTEKMAYFGVEVGGKQVVNVRLESPQREPLRQARFHLQRFVTSRAGGRVLPGVRDYFRDLAPTRLSFAPYLTDIDATIAGGELWRLPDTYREFVQDTLRVTAPQRHGAGWSMHVTLLHLPDTDPEQRIAWLRGVAARFGVPVVNVLDKTGPVPLSPRDTPLFALLAAQAREQYGVHAGSQVLYRAMTECRFLRTRGVACYGISPFPVNFFQSVSIHGRNERIRLDWFRQGVTYVDRVVQRWAFPGR